jgi:hypothetical protein
MVYLSTQDQMNIEGLLLLDVVSSNDTPVQTISVIHFRNCDKIQNKQHGKFTDSIILLHKNACPHVADRVRKN